ncbi:type I toxin-antitoxin system Fst family toxin [Ligilactobacillus aviarius]|nr:type I toxin-antitoxin system Fst family toxin [Ligilactobacillus aviarius]
MAILLFITKYILAPTLVGCLVALFTHWLNKH